MAIRILILSSFLLLCGCGDITVLYYVSVQQDTGTSCIKATDININECRDIVDEIVRKYHLIQSKIELERQPTIAYGSKSLEGQFKMLYGFASQDIQLTEGHLSVILYEYDSHLLIETSTFGGLKCAQSAKLINNELYERLAREYNKARVVKWSGFDCPEGFFDK